MSRWTYYSPFFIGVALMLAVADSFLTPEVAGGSARWAWIAALALAAGLVLQVGMLGAQGVMAQVLPVPGGRSIRGPLATAAGWLILAASFLTIAAALLASEEVGAPAQYASIAAGVAALAALGAYAWGWPAAVQDFSGRD